MKGVGVSVYLGKSHESEILEYLDLASGYGATGVFTCCLCAPQDAAYIKKELTRISQFAHGHGMEVIVDMTPEVFSNLGVSYDNLSFFHEVGVNGLRLDEGFDGAKEAEMTTNPHGIHLIINASRPTRDVDSVMSYQPVRDRISGCHNFFPQRYTGLGVELFKKCNANFKQYHLPLTAFMTSQAPGTHGPWEVEEGLPTLEDHRNLPIDLQARHLFQLGIDKVFIGNAFASEEEFQALSKVDRHRLQFRVELEKPLSEVEREILYRYPHHVRGDMSEYMARSTFPRITYKDATIPAQNSRPLQRGDVVILNEKYGRYKGELHIVLKPMPNEGNKNVLGRIPDLELFLLDFIDPWIQFGFLE